MWVLESSALDDAVQTWTSADLDGERCRIPFEKAPSLLRPCCIGEAECLYLEILYQQTTRTYYIEYLYCSTSGADRSRLEPIEI